MASTSAGKAESPRRPLHGSKSFSRIEPASPGSSTRSSRANTIQSITIPERPSLEKENGTENIKPSSHQGIFDKSSEAEKKNNVGAETINHSPIGIDELPIELKALTDRYRREGNILEDTLLTVGQLHRFIVSEDPPDSTYY
jgi:hypothetical protein